LPFNGLTTIIEHLEEAILFAQNLLAVLNMLVLCALADGTPQRGEQQPRRRLRGVKVRLVAKNTCRAAQSLLFYAIVAGNPHYTNSLLHQLVAFRRLRLNGREMTAETFLSWKAPAELEGLKGSDT
jgi:hypothetical protein